MTVSQIVEELNHHPNFVPNMTAAQIADQMWQQGYQLQDCPTRAISAAFERLQAEWDRAHQWSNEWAESDESEWQPAIDDDYEWIRHGC